jgi:DNA-binding MarR family transcriptional regulator
MVALIARSLAVVTDTVTVPQLWVLVVLSNHGPLRTGEIAEHLGVNQSSLTRLADRMVAAGLITRSTGRSDRREVIISATDRGVQALADITAARRQEIAAVLGRLGPAEQDAVRIGFELFARAADEPSADQASPAPLDPGQLGADHGGPDRPGPDRAPAGPAAAEGRLTGHLLAAEV